MPECFDQLRSQPQPGAVESACSTARYVNPLPQKCAACGLNGIQRAWENHDGSMGGSITNRRGERAEIGTPCEITDPRLQFLKIFIEELENLQ